MISLQPSSTLVVGSSTPALLTPESAFPSATSIDGFDIKIAPSLAVVGDTVTLRPGAAGVTISGKVVSLENGGSTLDIGTGRFALPTAANSSLNFQVFTGGGQRKKALCLSFLPIVYIISFTVVYYSR